MTDKPQNVEEFKAYWAESTDVPYGYCWCGCGSKTPECPRTDTRKRQFKGEPKRYCTGHTGEMHREDTGLPTTPEGYKEWWADEAPEGVPYGFCWCGCGQLTRTVTSGDIKKMRFKGEPGRYISGHMGGKKTPNPEREKEKKVVRPVEAPIPTFNGRCFKCNTKLNSYTIKQNLTTCGAHSHLDPNTYTIKELTA